MLTALLANLCQAKVIAVGRQLHLRQMQISQSSLEIKMLSTIHRKNYAGNHCFSLQMRLPGQEEEAAHLSTTA